MKKILLALGVFALSAVASAHTLQSIAKMTNPQAQAVLDLADSIEKADSRFTAVASYKIVQIKPVRKTNEDDVDVYIRVLKYSLHRDYPITGNDGGYGIGPLDTNMNSYKWGDTLQYFSRDDEAMSAQLQKALTVAAQSGLIVLSGDGSGNNTMASIIAVVDPLNNEMMYLMNSNFGSDD